ncbi:MAG: hypothetical protein M4579_005362 [Chaenotheca gracillima]|nr:MAG: hypothetical protein M4579_005362 [Chaenotheca gracillima]
MYEYAGTSPQLDSTHEDGVREQDFQHLQEDTDHSVAMGPDIFWSSLMDTSLDANGDNLGTWAIKGNYGLSEPSKRPHRTLRRAGASVAETSEDAIRHLHQGNLLPHQQINGSEISLPVSSGSSDITDNSINFSDVGQYIPGSFSDASFPATSGVYVTPTPLSMASVQSFAYSGESTWQSEDLSALTTPGTFTPAGVSSTDDQSLQTEIPYDPESQSKAWSANSTEVAHHDVTRADLDPTLTSVAMNRMANTSGATSITSPQFSVPSPGSRRSSVIQADSVPIDLNGLNIVHDFMSPISPQLSARSIGSSHMSRTSSRPYQPSLEKPLPWPTLNHGYDIDGIFALPSPLNGRERPRRMSDDTETGVARNDPLYNASPREDGMFHCPYEGQEDCNHKPAPLKCNYDKFVDSHLRPYRCKVKACAPLQFSSTACLLRHEREAHGMHGHGAKPFTCHFEDCERSVEGCGFPRRWNLLDHMKRVHDFKGDTSSRSSFSSTASTHNDHRKRKLARAQQKQSSKKSKSVSGRMSTNEGNNHARRHSSAHRAQQLQNLNVEQERFQSAMEQYLHDLRTSRTTLENDRLETQREGLGRAIAQIQQLHGELGSSETQLTTGERSGQDSGPQRAFQICTCL